MNCIVTAGPTYEELDQVRRMTNFSTGALGTELANWLAEHGHEVQLLRGHYSTCHIEPKTPRLQIFTTTADLSGRLEAMASGEAGAVFHAAAVSDFTFGKIWRRSESGDLSEINSRKISTGQGTVLAELTPTPKILPRLRGWFPKAQLIGWKYELEGDRAQAIATAERQVKQNSTDACVVNGHAYGAGYGFVKEHGQCCHLPNKTALFEALAKFITQTS